MNGTQRVGGQGPCGKTARTFFSYAPVLAIMLSAAATSAAAGQTDGFTEPYRTIKVAAAESGIIVEVKVREGDRVKQGQALALLDNDVHLALLAIAEKSMRSKGKLDTTLADLQLRRHRLSKFEELLASGHARQEEVDRARAEAAIAEGQVVSAQEDLAIREMEYHKIATQLERRVVRSPIDGVIAAAHKDQGEFVAPNSPDVFTVVQLDPLVAVFAVMSAQARKMKVGETIEIRFADGPSPAKGTIEFIAPMTDAESGTVQVKMRIDNPKGLYRSGERCSFQLPD